MSASRQFNRPLLNSSALAATHNSNTVANIITTGGNVGIGTASPSSLLHISGANSARGLRMQTTTQHASFVETLDGNSVTTRVQSNVNNAFIGTVSNHPVDIYTSSTPRVSLTTGGNVGIGTTSPSGRLHVFNNSTGSSLRLTGLATNTASNTGIFFSNDDDIGLSRFKNKILAVGNGGWGQSDLHFCLNNQNNNNDAELSDTRMVITKGGNVGIGTTSPLYTLDVNGTLEASNANGLMLFASTGNVGIGTTSPSYRLDVNGNGIIRDTTFVVGNGTDNGFRTGWNVSGGLGETIMYDYRGLGPGAFHFKMLNTSNQDVGWAPISAGAYTNASDYRIKKNILPIDSNEAIQILRELHPVSYNLKDERDNQSLKYGFIAQDIENCIPHAVSKSPNIIPNFQQYFKYITYNDNKYELHVPSHKLNNGDKLRVNFDDVDGDHEVIVQIKDDDHIIFEHSHQTSSDSIFLYGTKVHDFRTLDYNVIHTLLHAATKDIDNRVQTLEQDKLLLLEKIQELETKYNQLLNFIQNKFPGEF